MQQHPTNKKSSSLLLMTTMMILVFFFLIVFLQKNGSNPRNITIDLMTAGLFLMVFWVIFMLDRYIMHIDKLQASNASTIHKNSREIEELSQRLKEQTKLARRANSSDPLTGLFNRSFLYSFLPKIKESALMPISIVVFDTDGLTKINHTEGFPVGDAILKNFANLLVSSCKPEYVVSRSSNDEFVVVLPNTSETETYRFSREIKIRFPQIKDEVDFLGELSISSGISTLYDPTDDILKTLEKAKQNLHVEALLSDVSNQHNVLALLQKSLISRTSETEHHCRRLRDVSRQIGLELGLPHPELQRLEVAAQLHDIGKIAIPDSILQKKGTLSTEERSIMEKHAEIGYHIAETMPVLKEMSLPILQHHENYDGTGYPQGLKGNEISLLARIIAVSDSFDAMTNSRIYSKAISGHSALNNLVSCSGTKYDPMVIQAFSRVFHKSANL